ncbi:Topless-related protein 1, partial [Mucuna pruriens]
MENKEVEATVLGRELVLLILQYLGENEFKETAHMLEQESGVFFDMKYFENEVNEGNWDEVEKYLSAFTKLSDNAYSQKIFFEIRKHKYIEAVDSRDWSKAVQILANDLKVFAKVNQELFSEITELLTLGNIRENEKLSKYSDVKSSRALLFFELSKVIKANPVFHNKLEFPNITSSRLPILINQSLNWQHEHCKNPPENPQIKTLYVDHLCGEGAPSNSPANNLLHGSLPNTLVRSFNESSSPTSMDFHPIQQFLLIVGTNVGSLTLWDVISMKRLASTKVGVPNVSVKKVIWSPDGTFLGIGYSRNVVHIHSYRSWVKLRIHLQIDAHVGSVNDLVFSRPNQQLYVITCGDDKTIKVWNVASGARLFTLEGHEAPVYSLCPFIIEKTHVIFSASLDGRIKAWLYDNMGSRLDFEAPGSWYTTMACSSDGIRLFSCGTSKDWESSIVEWNQIDASVRRTYEGLGKSCVGVVQLDTCKNMFLAAGHDFSIKFWDMNNVQLLTSIKLNGILPATPLIRFNRGGYLLAVSANDNGIKILANQDGIRVLVIQEAMQNRARVPIYAAINAARVEMASSSRTLPNTILRESAPNLDSFTHRISQNSNQNIWH